MSARLLHHPEGSLAREGYAAWLDPEEAGWVYSGLRVAHLAPGGRIELRAEGVEMAVLPLAGSLRVTLAGKSFELKGRRSVFSAVSDWVYVPLDSGLILESDGGCEVALPSARTEKRFEPAYVGAAEVPVEVRGAGPSTRQVTNFMAPGVFDGADRLICVEVLTPDGNWSSYPPHKHDDSAECKVNNEEIYYFRLGRSGGVETSKEGFAMHRLYTADRSIDENVVIKDGDVFLIPRGYHGPSIAAPGYPLYYLNVLAGPGEGRSMAFCDDPSHHWVRDQWEGMPADPRCPMTAAVAEEVFQ